MVSGRFLPRLPACRCANRPNSTSLVLVGSRARPNLHLGRAALESPVRYGWHPKGTLFRLPGLGDIYAANVRCLIPLPVDGLEHGPDPFLEVLLRSLNRLAIHPPPWLQLHYRTFI